MDEFFVALVRTIHLSDESKYQRTFYSKIEKDIGVTYGGDTTDIENKNYILDGL